MSDKLQQCPYALLPIALLLIVYCSEKLILSKHYSTKKVATMMVYFTHSFKMQLFP